MIRDKQPLHSTCLIHLGYKRCTLRRSDTMEVYLDVFKCVLYVIYMGMGMFVLRACVRAVRGPNMCIHNVTSYLVHLVVQIRMVFPRCSCL